MTTETKYFIYNFSNFLIDWDTFSCWSPQAKLEALLFTSNYSIYQSRDSFIIYTGEQSHVKILLNGTVAVAVFVAVDFSCLYGYYHVQMRTEDKKRRKQ